MSPGYWKYIFIHPPHPVPPWLFPGRGGSLGWTLLQAFGMTLERKMHCLLAKQGTCLEEDLWGEMHAKRWGIWFTQPVFLHLLLGSGLEAPAWCPWPSQSRSLAAARLLQGMNFIWWAANVAARASPRMFWLVSQMNTWKQRGAWNRLNELDRLSHLVNMLQASFMFWAGFQSGSLFDSNQIAPHKS